MTRIPPYPASAEPCPRPSGAVVLVVIVLVLLLAATRPVPVVTAVELLTAALGLLTARLPRRGFGDA